MAKPSARLPQAGSAAAAEASAVAPAPDNGVPFGRQPVPDTSARPAAVKRRGKQLGMRVPDVIYDRLVRAADETGFTKSSLLAHALDEKLKALGY